jgi:hypothetical protein
MVRGFLFLYHILSMNNNNSSSNNQQQQQQTYPCVNKKKLRGGPAPLAEPFAPKSGGPVYLHPEERNQIMEIIRSPLPGNKDETRLSDP